MRRLVVVVVSPQARAEPPVGRPGARRGSGWSRRRCASASVVARGSASCGSAELMVNGCSGSSLFQKPYETNPVSCVRRANFV